ncbi:hypothetical protein MAR_005266, partial [Mya arenaria]
SGLSRTQVIVIATCSAVIGTFFIIAGALRIHSCIKRYRANREAVLSIARRTSTIGFNGTNLSRRESACSKASRQSHSMFKTGSHHDVNTPSNNSHHSSKHSLDNKPLLSVAHLNQRSDGTSWHGSLVYIDEDLHKRTKDHSYIGSDNGSEDDALLRKSPNSTGSSIDVPLADVYKIEKESLTSPVRSPERNMTSSGYRSESVDKSSTSLSRNVVSPSRSLVSPQRSEIFEPGGEDDEELDNAVLNEFQDNEEDTSASIHRSVSSRGDDSISKCNALDQNGEKGNEEEVAEGDRKDGRKRSKRQYSVDYFDGDEFTERTFNNCKGIYEADEQTEESSLIENATTGLNQSNNSLSENPSYQYGNQTEYCQNGNYRNYSYSPSINYHYLPNIMLDTSPLQSTYNYSLDTKDSFQEFDQARAGPKSPLSRMQSSDSYFETNRRFLCETKSTPPVIEETHPVIHSEIVPLSMYKSGILQHNESQETF